MNPVQARLISKGKDGRRAEVVVYFGEGPQRRSVTRHVRRGGNAWVGRNPDEAALAQLDAAEKTLEEARRHHESIEPLVEIAIKEIDEILERIRQYREGAREHEVPYTFLVAAENVLLKDQEVKAKTVKAALEEKIAESVIVLQAAGKRAEELRKSIPREVQFSF